MDIKKYIKNKDIEVTNDDFDIEKLENDLRKGYELSSEVEKKVTSAVEEVNKTSKSAYEELQSKYDDLEKRNTDITERNKTLALENVMTRAGFKDEDFKDVSAMRYSMFGEEKDDVKAIEGIKEKFKNTYFPTPVTEPVKAKDDLPINNGSVEPKQPSVTRTTSIKDLLIKK